MLNKKIIYDFQETTPQPPKNMALVSIFPIETIKNIEILTLVFFLLKIH